ncbi:hypothetical protein HYW40_02315 [Candidatus Curtissbacteria bacterium]|nr:hypothetical protein [Candidatus Curtissbacteria bacterium]
MAVKVGKSAPYVSNTLRLLSVPDVLKDALASGATTEGHVRALASLEDPHLIVEAYKIILSKTLSVRGAEELARKMRARENIQPRQQPQIRLQNEDLDRYQEEIAQRLQTDGATVKVKISQSRIEGKMQIAVRANAETSSAVIKRVRDAVINS